MENDTENLNVSLELGRRWLERHEVPSGPGVRAFRVSVGGEPFELRLDHRPEAAPHAGALPEDPRAASNQQVLLAVARAFLGSLVEYPRPEPDLERGWEAYRTQLLETHGFIFCPEWRELSGEHKEAVACLVREAGERDSLPSVASAKEGGQETGDGDPTPPSGLRGAGQPGGDESELLADVRWTLAEEGLDPDTDEFRARMAVNLEADEGPEFVSLSYAEWMERDEEGGER